MKKTIILFLVTLLFVSFVFAEDVNNTVLLQKLNQIEQKVNDMDRKIDNMDRKVDNIQTGINLIYDILGTVFSRISRLFFGWVLSSSPFPSDVSIEQGLSSIEGCYKSVFSYQNGNWKGYNPLRPNNTLDKLSPDYGYWIKVNCSEINWQIVVLAENCTNGYDDDLDNDIDCNDTDCIGDLACVCTDTDGDGYGVGNCLGPDCDDAIATCNTDCATDVDNDFIVDCADSCIDADGDNYGSAGGAGNTCIDVDCDDNDATIYPGAPELCDRKDNDCDGTTPADEIDDDNDGMTECEGDCDDADDTIYYGATEVCDNIDNDCDGVVDEGCIVCGNSIVEAGEECDDGNIDACGTCSSDCNGPGTGSDCPAGTGCISGDDCTSGICTAGICG